MTSNGDMPPKAKFSISDIFDGVINVQMNAAFARLLVSFISDIEGQVESEIWAFNKTLENASKGRLRRQLRNDQPRYESAEKSGNF